MNKNEPQPQPYTLENVREDIRRLNDERIALSVARMGGGVLALLTIGLLLYFAFRYAQQLLKPLGEAGSVIFLRLSAFILLCLGVQIVWDGLSELLLGIGLGRSAPVPG